MKSASDRLTPAQFGLTIASIAAAIVPHLVRMPLRFAVPIILLLVGRWIQRTYRGSRIPVWVKLPLIVAFPVAIILHFGNIFGREPGSVLACAMLALKLMETERRRDARAAISFACFVLMSALLFDSGLGFTFLLFAALSLFLAALRELEVGDDAHSQRTFRVALRDGMRAGGFALFAAVPLAVCVFVFFPRFGSPLWGAPSDSTARTGLGDRMAPGTIQELLIDDSPAFRVSFEGAPPPRSSLYWRGPVLWYFDGTGWMRPDYLARSQASGELRTSGSTVEYEVTLEPSDQRWLFALDMPVAPPENAARGSDMTLVMRNPVDTLTRYRATSSPSYVLDDDLSPQYRRLALALPSGFDPRARELAESWRKTASDDNAVIAAALDLFHAKFYYTLNVELLGRDSVDDFLFETQRGFCEHFASAFTFLMRAAGIPSRVVTGYQGGFYNSVGDYWVVRQSDAHAWSEVWLKGRGWVRVDPTAAVSPQRVELGARAAAGESAPWYQANWLQAVRNQFDLVNRVWNDAVVQFNVLRQQSLLTPFGVDKADYGDLMIALITISAILLGFFAWRVLRQPHVDSDPLDAAYLRLCKKLAKAGIERPPPEGPQTLAKRIIEMWPANRELQRLLARYETLRYACKLPSPVAVREFAQSVAKLRLQAIAKVSAQ